MNEISCQVQHHPASRAIARCDGTFTVSLDEDEPAFLVSMLVLVHTHPAGNARARSPLEESHRRHVELIAHLAPPAEAKGLPVAWHALWRLPPAMTWSAPGGPSWMRYPAVSLAAAVRPAVTRGR